MVKMELYLLQTLKTEKAKPKVLASGEVLLAVSLWQKARGTRPEGGQEKEHKKKQRGSNALL